MVLSSALVRIYLTSWFRNVFNSLYLCSGPNELSIINVDLLAYILGPQGLPKGPSKIISSVNAIFAYSARFPLPVWNGRLTAQGIDSSNHWHSLIGVRDLRRHTQLRKPWNNAFQSAALENYEDMLEERAVQLMTRLQKSCDEKVCVDFSDLISLFTFVYFSFITSRRLTS